MEFTFLFSQFMSGLTYGLMLFLVASGLSLIFGVMNILNFAHATFWLIGAYICFTFWSLMEAHQFALWVSIPLAAIGNGSLRVVLRGCSYQEDLQEGAP